jgi:hypothetical protein
MEFKMRRKTSTKTATGTRSIAREAAEQEQMGLAAGI